MITTMPGYDETDVSSDQKFYLSEGLGFKLNLTKDVFWATLIIASTIVTIYAICNIFSTHKVLSLFNPNVTINKESMILHSTLLVI